MSRGFCWIGVVHGKSPQNIGTLWRSAHGFGAAGIFTVGQRYPMQASDTTKAWRHVPLLHFPTIRDLIDHLPHACRLVGVEIAPKAHTLTNYVHPESACYLLGAEDHGLSPTDLARCHDLVQVPHAARCLNVATAGSILLYDRAVKATA